MNNTHKNAYFKLIHQIFNLLILRQKLEIKLAAVRAECEGMTFCTDDGRTHESELARISQTLNRIAKNHDKLIKLLEERLQIKGNLAKAPAGNAGHFNSLREYERLQQNRSEISGLISR